MEHMMAHPWANLAATSSGVRPPEIAAPANPAAVAAASTAAARRPPRREESGPETSAAASWPRLLTLAVIQ